MAANYSAEQAMSANLPAPKTFAPSREDVLSTLGFFFGDPGTPATLCQSKTRQILRTMLYVASLSRVHLCFACVCLVYLLCFCNSRSREAEGRFLCHQTFASHLPLHTVPYTDRVVAVFTFQDYSEHHAMTCTLAGLKLTTLHTLY